MDKRLKDYLETNGWDELRLLKSYALMKASDPKSILLDTDLWGKFHIWREKYLENFRERAYFQHGKLYYRFQGYSFGETKDKSISLMGKVLITKSIDNYPSFNELEGEFYVSKEFPAGVLEVLRQEGVIVREFNTDKDDTCKYSHCLLDISRLQSLTQTLDETNTFEMR